MALKHVHSDVLDSGYVVMKPEASKLGRLIVNGVAVVDIQEEWTGHVLKWYKLPSVSKLVDVKHSSTMSELRLTLQCQFSTLKVGMGIHFW